MTALNPAWRFGHHPRHIASLGLWPIDDWTVKVYTIAGVDGRVSPRLLDAAGDIVRNALPRPGVCAQRYGAAFVLVHEAQAFNTVAVDWWQNVNELNHRFFRAPAGSSAFIDITASGESACVWELRVQAFERDAWLTHVLTEGRADLEGYAQARLNEMC